MRNMQVISEQKLQGVLASRERQIGHCAAVTKVHVMVVGRNRLVERWQFGVDNNVVMTAHWRVGTRRLDVHAIKSELDTNRAGNGGAVGRFDKI